MTTTPRKPKAAPKSTRLTKLPGQAEIHIDLSTIACVRIESTPERGTVVIIHTNDGYGIGQMPLPEQSAVELVEQIVGMLP